MAKFFIECPHCGTSNQASTFIFAKKVIECGHCKQTINVKENRIVSRKCPHCKNVFLFDQKNERNTCPVCQKSVSSRFGKLVSFPCPECGCFLEAGENAQSVTCLVCDHEIDVAKAVAKSKLVTDGTVSVIKYEGDNDTFVWKHPIEDFNLGSQLIVHESQEAIFFMDGQALDTFGPGRYPLETQNLPLLKQMLALPTGKQNPFHAEVYFVNKTVQMSIPWGTPDRVHFVDPETGAPIDIGASGEMNLQVSDARKLLIKLVGTTSGIAWGTESEHAKDHYFNDRKVQLDPFAHSLRAYFKPLIRTMVKANLAQIIKREHIDILEIDERLDELSNALREKLSAGFEEYGLTIPQFYVTTVSLPDDKDENFQIIKKFHTEKLKLRNIEYEKKMRLAKQAADIEAATGALEFDRIKAEKDRIAAQGKAAADTIAGEAAIELQKKRDAAEAQKIELQGVATGKAMEAQGYTKKDEFAKDAQVAWATGIGQMGSNGGGGGGMMSDVASMGAAMAMMGTMAGKMSDAVKGIGETDATLKETPTVPDIPVAANGWDCACGKKGNTGKFCSECGTPKPEAWDCACGKKGNTGKFCSECGAPKPEAWDCACGKKGNTGKFCSECGAPKQSAGTWDCACGKKGIPGKFCPECGAKKGGAEE